MIGLLPPLGVKGSFEVRTPYAVQSDIIYVVTGHRTLKQMILADLDPLKTIYLDKGLREEDFNLALASDVVIVTLSSGQTPELNIPSSHFNSYDNGSFIEHQHVIVTASCGILPSTFDKTRIKEAVRNSLFQFTGIEAEVFVVVQDTAKKVTQNEANAAEAQRQVNMTYGSTTYQDKLKLVQENQDLRAEVQRLIEVIDGLQDNS